MNTDLPETEKPSPQCSRMKYVLASRKFLNHYGKKLVWWANSYWHYSGTHYEEAGSEDFMRMLIDRWHQTAATGLQVSGFSAMEIEGRLRSACFCPLDQAMPGKLGQTDKHRFKTALRNGILDLHPCLAGKQPVLAAHSEEWFCTSCLPYDYDPHAECPRWLEFLGQSLSQDPERVAVLQEWFGYCCTFDTSLEKMLLMEGPGANGKTQAMDVLRAMVGHGNCSATDLGSLGRQFAPVGTLGKLVNICGETDPGIRVPVATLRHLVTGESFTFERKGKDTFTADPTARFVISMNQRPQFADPTNALWRRIILMPWTNTVPSDKQIPDLGKKIAAAELPGIFNWAVKGLIRLWTNGRFTESRAVTEAGDSLRAESDPIRTWLLTQYSYEPARDVAVPRSDLWDAIRVAEARKEIVLPVGYTPPRLIADVSRVFPGIVSARRKAGAQKPHVWVGLTEAER